MPSVDRNNMQHKLNEKLYQMLMHEFSEYDSIRIDTIMKYLKAYRYKLYQ